ncbi:MAG: helix-turn-helix domain-containing protein [Candidatus Binatia bacterium]
MPDERIPDWWFALGPDIDRERVYRVFEAALKQLPMSQSDLGDAVGGKVDQSKVSKWARGIMRPSLEQMEKALNVLEPRTEEIQRRLRAAREVLSSIQAAAAAKAGYKESGSEKDLKKLRKANKELRELLRKA